MSWLRSALGWGLAVASLASAADTLSSSTYTDPLTNITFNGISTSSGFQCGIALPSSSAGDNGDDDKTQLVAQIVSPLASGAGWGAIDFGKSMSGPLLLVAWPNTDSKTNASVTIAPRMAHGYHLDDTTTYTNSPISIAPIPAGTFTNKTHLTATFVCTGCVDNADAFSASDKQSTFAYAYSKLAVQDPSDPDTLLSDHTSSGGSFGSFDFTLADAQSDRFSKWVAQAASNSTTGQSGQNSTSGSDEDHHGSGPSEDTEYNLGPFLDDKMVVLIVMIGVIYIGQIFI